VKGRTATESDPDTLKVSKNPSKPNHALISARESIPSAFDPLEPMSRDELADCLNKILFDLYSKDQGSKLGKKWSGFTGAYMGSLERGEISFPNDAYKQSLEKMFGRSVAELGFRPKRRGRQTTTITKPTEHQQLEGLAVPTPTAFIPRSRTTDVTAFEGDTLIEIPAGGRSREAHSVASLAPPITPPQRRVPPDRLRGREQLLTQLATWLPNACTARSIDESSVLVLHGAGGIGKTTIAVELAHRAGIANALTWWVQASSPELVRAALHAVAFAAGATDEDFDRAHAADVLWRSLERLSRPWLLVIDNLDDPTIVVGKGQSIADGVGWIRPIANQHGAILITSRDGRPDRWAPWMRLERVSSLSAESGAAVLTDLAPDAGPPADARQLAAALEGLPLALDLAGRYLASTTSDLVVDERTITSFTAYNETLEQRLMELPMTVGDQGSTDFDARAVGTTWTMSIDLLERQGHALAGALARLIAAFPPLPIPVQSVIHMETLRPRPAFASATARTVSGALKALAGIGLVTLLDASVETAAPALVSMHPLVRAAIRTDLAEDNDPELRLELVTDLLVAATSDLDPNDASNWPRWSYLAPHCSAVFDAMDGGTGAYSHALSLANRAAWYKYMAGSYQQAKSDARSIWSRCEGSFGETSAEAISARNVFARCTREAGDPTAAEDELRSTLELAMRHLGPSNPTTLNIRINLARTVRERGDLVSAETDFRSIVAVAREVLGEEDPDTLVAWMNLAAALRQQGRHGDAETEYRAVLSAWRRRFSEHDLTTLDIRYEMAEAMRQGGGLAQAEAELRTILDITVQVFGHDHPNALIIRNGLAATLRDAGRLDAARDEVEQIHELRLKRLGESHPLTISAREELARLSR
jgi:tetratricopeptide (TPR) repeat protein